MSSRNPSSRYQFGEGTAEEQSLCLEDSSKSVRTSIRSSARGPLSTEASIISLQGGGRRRTSNSGTGSRVSSLTTQNSGRTANFFGNESISYISCNNLNTSGRDFNANMGSSGQDFSPGRGAPASPNSARRPSVFTTASGTRFFHDGGDGPPVRIVHQLDHAPRTGFGGQHTQEESMAQPYDDSWQLRGRVPGHTTSVGRPSYVHSEDTSRGGPLCDRHGGYPPEDRRHHPHHHQYRPEFSRESPIFEENVYTSRRGSSGRERDLVPPPQPPPPTLKSFEPHIDSSAPSRRCLEKSLTKYSFERGSRKDDEPLAPHQYIVTCRTCHLNMVVSKIAVVVQCLNCKTVSPATDSYDEGSLKAPSRNSDRG